MLSEILQNVHESGAHLARRPEGSRMIALGPHPAATSGDAVDCPCDPDGEALESASEDLRRSVGLNKEMDVVALNREFEDPEADTGRAANGVPHRAEHALGSQRRKAAAGAEGHVHRTARLVCRAAPVRDVASARMGSTTGTRAASTPRPSGKLQLVRHLKRADNIANETACQVQHAAPRRTVY